MGMLRKKVVAYTAGFPVTLALSAGMATPMVVADATVAARSAAAAPVVPRDLKDALLALEDLPKGYSVLDFDPSDGLAGVVDRSRMNSDPCRAQGTSDLDDLPPDPDQRPVVVIRPGRPDRPDRPGRPDSRPDSRPDRPDKPARAQPGGPTLVTELTTVEGPTVARGLVAVAPPAERRVEEPELAGVGFIKGTEGPVLLHTLVDVGRRQARALIEQTREVLKRCPDVETDTVRIEQDDLPRFPELGDDSVAVSMTITLKEDNYEVSVDGKLVAFAVDGVYATVALVGLPTPGTGELRKIGKAAERRLERG